MSDSIHLLLLANGVVPIAWAIAGQWDHMKMMQTMTWALMGLAGYSLVVAGMVWP